MENGLYGEYNSLFRRPTRFRRVASSGIKDITKTLDTNGRNPSISQK